DCYGHGTHVAATAAGFGVLNDGSGGFGGTFTGPYDAAVQTRSFFIGPGVAPQANIVALKIFGCRGSSDLTELAIDWAVDPNGDGDFADKVDVINMSIGSPYGTTDDPTAVASDNAALAGVIVVASAGNSGNVFFAASSPAVADRAVSVAAIRNHLDLTGDPLAAPVATTSFTVRGPRPGDSALKPDIAAPGQGVNSAVMGAPGWYSGTWSGTSMAAPHVAGALTLLRQRYPSWSVEELKALVMNSAAFAVDDGVILPSPARVGAGIIDLTRALDAPLVAMDARGNGRVSLSFTPADVLDVYTDTLDLRLVNKQGITLTYAPLYAPVVDLPGVDIRPDAPTVTVRPNGNALLPVQMTARAEAMGHPRPADVNATSSYPRHWLDEESGRLELWPTGPVYHAALQATMAAPAPTDDPHGTADLSYDPTSETLTYQLTVTNAEATAFSQIELRAATATGEPGAVVATLPAPTTVTTVTNTAIGATTLAPDVARAMANGRLMLRAVKPGTQPLELTGPITADALVLQTPVFATARRMADLHSVAPALTLDPVPGIITATLTLTGAGRAATTRADGGPALMTILARQFSSPQQAAGDARADLQYIGISSDLYQDVNGPIANHRLYMGLTTYGAWTSPNEVRMDIFIDTDEDGVDDYRLFNADALGYASDDATSDGLVAVVETLARGTFSALEPL
ncbi:MAG: S8 family serine peptidase, partial [Caldilineaceae bacterium]|nr:S8 family serine peptidase [Caldilineaceae bacterium]